MTDSFDTYRETTRKIAAVRKKRLAELVTDRDLLTTPRPIAEYHEDMGPVLWWWWEAAGNELPGRWAGELPYVGSPNDCGFTVEAHATTRIITQANQKHHPKPTIHRINIGGWPGYHTHFTPLPPMPKEPTS